MWLCGVFFLVVFANTLPTGSVSSLQELFVNATNEAIETGTLKLSIGLHDDTVVRASLSAPSNYDCTVRSAVPADVRARLGLSTYYTQYAHAYGIPVLSSSRVKPKALERACYVMRFLFADRKDIRDWFYRRKGRAGIMARSEGTTMIPEHSFLPSWWNERARGLGATIHIPISTGGEENLLCERPDRYYNEDIFLHEFVHGIHNLGATGAIPTFDRRLKAAYESARSNRLWWRTYALSTDREYFAEGTQSFFNVNAYSAKPNGIHNDINTRKKLQTYDPALYDLIKEVFPCENEFLKRCDARKGKLPQPFKMDCKDGGTVVTLKPETPPVPPHSTTSTPSVSKPTNPDTPPVPTSSKSDTPPVPTTPSTPSVSKPTNPDTPPVPTPSVSKSSTSHVTTPPVTTTPKRTPPVTTTPKRTPPVTTIQKRTPPVTTTPKRTPRPTSIKQCNNHHKHCNDWAKTGECQRNPAYMLLFCCRSCRIYKYTTTPRMTCRDNHKNCRFWAYRGHCRYSYYYMTKNCRNSCGLCR